MRSWVQSKRGSLRETLELKEVAAPKPSSSRPLLVKVKAAALNPVDYKLRELAPNLMVKRPGVPCSDFSGVIVDGARDGFKVGDEVVGMIPAEQAAKHGIGALSEIISVASTDPLAPKPTNLSFAEAAAAPLTLLTASMFFRQSKATRGQRVFINGASGGVGLLAVQLAKVKGLYVVASCSERTRAFVESLKPDEIVDYQKTPLEQYLPQTYPAGTDKALDYVFDCIGTAKLYNAAPKFLGPKGAYFDIAGGPADSMGDMLQQVKTLAPRFLRPSFLGGNRIPYKFFLGEMTQANFDEVVPYLRDGSIKVKVDATYSFDKALDAYDRLKSHRAVGKVVVEV